MIVSFPFLCHYFSQFTVHYTILQNKFNLATVLNSNAVILSTWFECKFSSRWGCSRNRFSRNAIINQWEFEFSIKLTNHMVLKTEIECWTALFCWRQWPATGYKSTKVLSLAFIWLTFTFYILRILLTNQYLLFNISLKYWLLAYVMLKSWLEYSD